MANFKDRIAANGFIVALLAAILVAYWFPEGARVLALSKVTDIGIGLIFFFYGLKLSAANFKAGVSNYKLHLLIHLSTFVLFPLLILPFKPMMSGETTQLLWVGVFFIAVLPSTVSSSVVMVSIARGNVPAAIFNASLSGLIGVVLTPLWLSLVVKDVQGISLPDVVVKLMLQIVAPLGIGLLLHQKLGHLARKYSKGISFFDKSIIVLIVYSSFCTSFLAGLFSGLNLMDFLLLYAVVLGLFLIMTMIIHFLAKALGFSTADRITAIFCGSKKSLVHGSVMAKIMFGHSTNASIYIFPIMLYHISQLLIIAYIAERFRRRDEVLANTE